MSTPKMVVVTRFASTPEAELAQAALGNQGIESFVQGAQANIVLTQIAAGPRGVRLLVDEKDLQVAREIVLQHSEKSGPDHEWKCSHCSATVDAGFEVCWSCGASYDPSLPIA